MRTWKSFVRAALLLAIGMTLAGNSLACNTMHGAGKDVERAGEKVQDAADDAHH